MSSRRGARTRRGGTGRLLPLAALAAAACAAVAFVSARARAIELVSVREEIEIGRQADRRVRQELPPMRDAGVNAYVAALGRRLVRVAPGPKYPYRFAVADYREINAFALPGGPIWINRGVLHAATTEAQVAGVLAHEIAHVARRHAASQLTKSMVAEWGLGFLGAVLGNTGGASAARAAAGLMTNGMFLKFSRDDERDADRVGLLMLTRAGWDARGMIELFETLRREARRDPLAVEVFFSSHPPPAERIDELRREVARHRGGRRTSEEFGRVRARVLAMRPPRQMASR